MKYIVAVVLGIIIFFICLPIILIKWDVGGMEEIWDGLKELCGID